MQLSSLSFQQEHVCSAAVLPGAPARVSHVRCLALPAPFRQLYSERMAFPAALDKAVSQALVLTALVLLGGCVSQSSYELARKDAENMKLLLQTERQRTQQLAAENKQMQAQIPELESALRSLQGKLVEMQQAYRAARDEMLGYKIQREREYQMPPEEREPRARSRVAISKKVETDMTRSRPEEQKLGLKALLHQLQDLLRHVE
jgi:hypothetical protein